MPQGGARPFTRMPRPSMALRSRWPCGIQISTTWRRKTEPAGGGGKSPDEYLRDLARHTERSPYASDNFLKNGFLQACKDAGLFEPQAHPNIAP